MPTDPPYWTKRSAIERTALYLADVTPGSIVSGSVVRWGPEIEDAFDLIVLLSAPTEVRIERLRGREDEHPGRILDDFLVYAAGYDDGGLDMRSRATHEKWLAQRTCPVLRLDGTAPVEANVRRVLDSLP